MILRREREALAEVAHRVAAEGLVTGTAGNLSVRAGARVAISPTGSALGELEAADVTVVDLDGGQLDGPGRPSSELGLHLGAYRRFPARAIVHTHAPAAVALACVLEELPVIHYALLELGGAIRVAGYATYGTEELAAATLDALEGRHAVLMAHHGTLALGEDLQQALERTRLLEWACRVYRDATVLGEPRVLTDAQCEAVLEAHRRRR